MPIIRITTIKKNLGGKQVLKGISLDVHKGEKLVVIGRSGCGKSVLLKHMVGLMQPDSGTVEVYKQDLSGLGETGLAAIRLKIGFLFQGAALFDSMTVGENVSLPLIENFSFTQREIAHKVAEKLELVGLPGIQKLKPSELSGGMRKRVGLARAIITEPEVIFYDEPTTGLDPIMSDAIDNLVNSLAERLQVTSVVVTHDMDSVKKVADRVIMLHEGHIFFDDAPDRLFQSDNHVVRNFVNRSSVDDDEIVHEMEDLAVKAGQPGLKNATQTS